MVLKKGMGHKERETLVEPLETRPPPPGFSGRPSPSLQPARFPLPLSQCHPGTLQLRTAQQMPSYMRPGAHSSHRESSQPTHKRSSLPSADHCTGKSIRTASTPSGRILPLMQIQSRMSRDTLLNEALQPTGLNVTMPPAENPQLYPSGPKSKGEKLAPKPVGWRREERQHSLRRVS